MKNEVFGKFIPVASRNKLKGESIDEQEHAQTHNASFFQSMAQWTKLNSYPVCTAYERMLEGMCDM